MLVHVATITGAHGIKGEVKIKSLTAVAKDFASYGPLVTADGRVFEVGRAKQANDTFICTLKNILDRNHAEALRGTELFVAREKLPALNAGEVYLTDVEGKQAVADGKSLGRIVGFHNFGAGELMELEGGRLVPVSCITVVAEAVMLDLPDGFLDDERAR